MAYNSDGYIMIDFKEVDFSRTNQTIEGLFDRCQKVIGTNKFVMVINANNKTPLPSTVCITNGQYVIESVLFTFSISSSDNLHITKKTTPEELIDDSHITRKTTWSSDKINDEIDNVAIKSFTYRGNGSYINNITFPTTPKLILLIDGPYSSSADIKLINTQYGAREGTAEVYYHGEWTSSVTRGVNMSYEDNVVTISASQGTAAERVLNINNGLYTVYYI